MRPFLCIFFIGFKAGLHFVLRAGLFKTCVDDAVEMCVLVRGNDCMSKRKRTGIIGSLSDSELDSKILHSPISQPRPLSQACLLNRSARQHW